jgi:hypothetical protein
VDARQIQPPARQKVSVRYDLTLYQYEESFRAHRCALFFPLCSPPHGCQDYSPRSRHDGSPSGDEIHDRRLMLDFASTHVIAGIVIIVDDVLEFMVVVIVTTTVNSVTTLQHPIHHHLLRYRLRRLRGQSRDLVSRTTEQAAYPKAARKRPLKRI